VGGVRGRGEGELSTSWRQAEDGEGSAVGGSVHLLCIVKAALYPTLPHPTLPHPTLPHPTPPHTPPHPTPVPARRAPHRRAHTSTVTVSGEDNGETDAETTTFYFEIQPDALRAALGRFAAFFASPLLSWDSSAREVKAIEVTPQHAGRRARGKRACHDRVRSGRTRYGVDAIAMGPAHPLRRPPPAAPTHHRFPVIP